jgi:hypothetical protein
VTEIFVQGRERRSNSTHPVPNVDAEIEILTQHPTIKLVSRRGECAKLKITPLTFVMPQGIIASLDKKRGLHGTRKLQRILERVPGARRPNPKAGFYERTGEEADNVPSLRPDARLDRFAP